MTYPNFYGHFRSNSTFEVQALTNAMSGARLGSQEGPPLFRKSRTSHFNFAPSLDSVNFHCRQTIYGFRNWFLRPSSGGWRCSWWHKWGGGARLSIASTPPGILDGSFMGRIWILVRTLKMLMPSGTNHIYSFHMHAHGVELSTDAD